MLSNTLKVERALWWVNSHQVREARTFQLIIPLPKHILSNKASPLPPGQALKISQFLLGDPLLPDRRIQGMETSGMKLGKRNARTFPQEPVSLLSSPQNSIVLGFLPINCVKQTEPLSMASSWGHILFNKRLRFNVEQSLKGKVSGRVTDQRWRDSLQLHLA